MQKDSKILDDLTKLTSGALSSFSDMKRDMEGLIADRVEKMLYRMNLVKREEFEVVRLLAEQARRDQEDLKQRVAALEAATHSHSTETH